MLYIINNVHKEEDKLKHTAYKYICKLFDKWGSMIFIFIS